VGVAAAILASVVSLYPLTAGSALSVWTGSLIVAVTSLIAGWPGGAVLLLFLTVVTLATGATLGGVFLAAGATWGSADFVYWLSLQAAGSLPRFTTGTGCGGVLWTLQYL